MAAVFGRGAADLSPLQIVLHLGRLVHSAAAALPRSAIRQIACPRPVTQVSPVESLGCPIMRIAIANFPI